MLLFAWLASTQRTGAIDVSCRHTDTSSTSRWPLLSVSRAFRMGGSLAPSNLTSLDVRKEHDRDGRAPRELVELLLTIDDGTDNLCLLLAGGSPDSGPREPRPRAKLDPNSPGKSCHHRHQTSWRSGRALLSWRAGQSVAQQTSGELLPWRRRKCRCQKLHVSSIGPNWPPGPSKISSGTRDSPLEHLDRW